MSYASHREAAKSIVANVAVITLSDTRTVENDKSGQTIQQLLKAHGHAIVRYGILPDLPTDQLQRALHTALCDEKIDTIVTNGGTGIARRDAAIATIEQVIDTPLPGFGELFRMLSYEQIGSGALASRSVAGVAQGKLIFALPGSTKAVELAMTKLILPELQHLLYELKK